MRTGWRLPIIGALIVLYFHGRNGACKVGIENHKAGDIRGIDLLGGTIACRRTLYDFFVSHFDAMKNRVKVRHFGIAA